jgi:hypothetical protein
MDRMDNLLSFTPHLKCLVVKATVDEYSQLDFSRLARIFNNRVPYLQQFSCSIGLSLCGLNISIPNIALIWNISPLFRNMTVTFDWCQGLMFKT